MGPTKRPICNSGGLEVTPLTFKYLLVYANVAVVQTFTLRFDLIANRIERSFYKN